MPQGWDPASGTFPRAPKNLQVFSTYLKGSYDLRWDHPTLMPENFGWTILGVNIYRSDVSDRGPFYKINQYPIGSTFYRDQTEFIRVSKEVIAPQQWLFNGNAPNNKKHVFRTRCPIVKNGVVGSNMSPTFGDSPTDVIVTVDGIPTEVEWVFGKTGEVSIVNLPTIDWATEKYVEAQIPQTNSTVEISYWSYRNFIRSGLDTKIHYRVTTLGIDANNPSKMIETPLNYAEPRSSIEVESLDYIWREAVRRNNWILEQGGERVKVFIRKQSGVPCPCVEIERRHLEQSKQPDSMCLKCFGTGFVGGYEGPWPLLIAPDEAERRISQTVYGRRKEHTYEVWTGPSPMLSQRDFLVKQTNERYSLGPIRRPSNRGNVLQQHFQIGYLDEQDLRYQVLIKDPQDLTYPETRYVSGPYALAYPTKANHPGYPAYRDSDADRDPPFDTSTDTTYPQRTEKGKIGDEREVRGRSPVWENQNY